MNYLNALFLGIVQGLTEFLPVSSSAHLALIQSLLPSFSQPGILFDVVLHLGTLFAIVFYFRKDLFKLSFSYIKYIVIATIPAVFFGFLFSDQIEGLFKNIKLIGFALLLSALFNFLADRKKKENSELDTKKSFIVGLFQALAITPGISRSGSTIFAGVFSGLERKEAARFSFLLSIPAVLGANLLQVVKYGFDFKINLGVYIVGFFASFFAGILAIKLAFRFLLSRNFKFFAFYCLILSLVAFLI
jgi:undecaprenyl-diphosphatase